MGASPGITSSHSQAQSWVEGDDVGQGGSLCMSPPYQKGTISPHVPQQTSPKPY